MKNNPANQNTEIKCLVELYRDLNRPSLEEGGYLRAQSESINLHTIELLQRVHKVFPEKFERLRFEGNDIDSSDTDNLAQYENQSMDLAIQIPPHLFYSDLEKLVKTRSSLSMGEMREDFYLINEDYYPDDNDTPKELTQLEKICEWIRFLQKVLQHTEERKTWLTFVLFPEPKNGNRRSKITFQSKILFSDLDSDLSRTSEFLKITDKNDIHSSERESVFRQTLAELLIQNTDRDNAFSFLLKNMEDLCQNYHDSYARYINGFSLEKLKQEVIENSELFSTQIKTALNEIITKSFAVPASLAAAALLVRLDNTLSDITLTLVILFTTSITVLSLSWQSTHILSIISQINARFSNYIVSGKSGEAFAKKNKKELNTSARGVQKRIRVLRVLCWVPVVLSGIYLWAKYPSVQNTFDYFADPTVNFILDLLPSKSPTDTE